MSTLGRAAEAEVGAVATTAAASPRLAAAAASVDRMDMVLSPLVVGRAAAAAPRCPVPPEHLPDARGAGGGTSMGRPPRGGERPAYSGAVDPTPEPAAARRP